MSQAGTVVGIAVGRTARYIAIVVILPGSEVTDLKTNWEVF